jgi:uncharacterized membrane protein YphA (DoxX/SURF4 family)
MIARWVAVWDRREGPESLALLRILVPLVILLDLAEALRLGLLPGLWVPPPDGIGWVGATEAAPPFTRLLGASTATAWIVIGLAVLGALLLLAGVFHRLGAVLLALATAELARLAPDGERAVDVLLRIAVLVLAFSRADACWSIASWLRRRAGHPPLLAIPAWPRQLLFLQLVWVYFSAAQNRGGAAWWPSGELSAIANILSDPHYARFTPGWTAVVFPLTQASTALTMLFELGAPILVPLTLLDRGYLHGGAVGAFVRRFRLRFVYLGLGVLLHLGIWLTMRLGIFSLGMLSLYSVLLDPSEIRAALARFGRAVGRPPSGADTAGA